MHSEGYGSCLYYGTCISIYEIIFIVKPVIFYDLHKSFLYFSLFFFSELARNGPHHPLEEEGKIIRV